MRWYQAIQNVKCVSIFIAIISIGGRGQFSLPVHFSGKCISIFSSSEHENLFQTPFEMFAQAFLFCTFSQRTPSLPLPPGGSTPPPPTAVVCAVYPFRLFVCISIHSLVMFTIFPFYFLRRLILTHSGCCYVWRTCISPMCVGGGHFALSLNMRGRKTENEQSRTGRVTEGRARNARTKDYQFNVNRCL